MFQIFHYLKCFYISHTPVVVKIEWKNSFKNHRNEEIKDIEFIFQGNDMPDGYLTFPLEKNVGILSVNGTKVLTLETEVSGELRAYMHGGHITRDFPQKGLTKSQSVNLVLTSGLSHEAITFFVVP